MRHHQVARRYSGQWEMPLTEMRAGSSWLNVHSESAMARLGTVRYLCLRGVGDFQAIQAYEKSTPPQKLVF